MIKKYRIKTEKEFIGEFGENWRYEVSCWFVEPMDHLLGMEVDFLPVEISSNNIDTYNPFLGWGISNDMLIEVNTKIDYNTPRKLIYD